MRKTTATLGALAVAATLTIGAGTAFAMPSDIEEAVTSGD